MTPRFVVGGGTAGWRTARQALPQRAFLQSLHVHEDLTA